MERAASRSRAHIKEVTSTDMTGDWRTLLSGAPTLQVARV